MAIKGLLKPADPAQLLAKLEADVNSTRNQVDVASAAWTDALMDEVEGIGDPGRTEAAERALDAARRAHDAATAALATARTRAAANGLKAQAEALAKKWDAAVSLASRRQAAVEKLAKASEVYAAAHADLLQVNDDLLAALPHTPDADGARLRPAQIEGSAKVDLARLGVSWASTFISFGRAAAPSLEESFAGTLELIKSWRDRAVKRS